MVKILLAILATCAACGSGPGGSTSTISSSLHTECLCGCVSDQVACVERQCHLQKGTIQSVCGQTNSISGCVTVGCQTCTDNCQKDYDGCSKACSIKYP